MAHLAPVARWFGFGFGYTVAEAVALVTVARVADRATVLAVADAMTITLVVIAWGALVRTMFRIWRENSSRPAGPLGTYAKSDSQMGGGAEGHAAHGLGSGFASGSVIYPGRTTRNTLYPLSSGPTGGC